MGTRKRTSEKRKSRNREDSNGSIRSDQPLITAFRERRALMRADAVLRCVAVALEYDDWSSDGPDYVEAIEVARSLISQSIEQLESRSSPDTLSAKAQQ
jgi:hypothetical protein